MEQVLSSATTDAARKTAKDAQDLGKALKHDVEDVVQKGRDVAHQIGTRVNAYADDNTALVAVAAFGAGLLVGHLVTRR
jgi:ElaB/YqjD/DUF883 family membrane-anchored ribosome-binding protein